MKTSLAFCAAALLSLAPLAPLAAQDVVTAGTITSFAPQTGTLTLVPADRATTPIVFHHMDRTQILFSTGALGTAADLRAGVPASIHYQKAGDRWMISKIVLTAPGTTPLPANALVPVPLPGAAVAVPGTPLPSGEVRALQGAAANDGDRTTQPGSKATIDRDITTQPGSKAMIDRDRTTQPGSKAAIDRDITTQPGSKAAVDADRTTQPGSKAATDDDITTKPGASGGVRRGGTNKDSK